MLFSWRYEYRFIKRAQKTLRVLPAFVLVTILVFTDLGHIMSLNLIPSIPIAEANSSVAIKVESFDQDVTTDGSTFSLVNDVGATSSAFIRMNTGTRKTSAGPTGSTANTGPNVGTVGLVLTDTNEVTVERVDATAVKVMGEVWRYQGLPGAGNEFIVRDRVSVSLTGASASVAVSGIGDVDRVVPFMTGYTVNDASVANWEAATIAAHMDDSGNLVVSRNNTGTAATVYVDVVEFTGSDWQVCHGYSNAHDTAQQTITLNTDSDGQGGSTCDVTDWGTATIIEATMEGDSGETGLSDTLALVRPGADTTSVVFDLQQDANARNDGQAWIHVLQNDNMVVNRTSNSDLAEGNGTFGTATWPSGATTTADFDTLSLEWFTDTSGVGTAHMRGGLHARITGETIYQDGDLVAAADYDSTVEGNFSGEVTFAASPSGVIYEAGGTGTGAFVGYNDSGDFIIRAGNGASVTPTDAARIVITSSDYDFSNRTGTLNWTFDPVLNSVDLSFDEDSNGSIDFATSTTAAAAWLNWSGGDDGNVGNSNGNVAGSEITSGFDFNGTIQSLQFVQGVPEITHWIHRSGNTVGVEYGVIELSGLAAITETTIVSANGSQRANIDVGSTNVELGGSFVISDLAGSRNVTSILLSESGTVDGANGLNNIEIYYDLDTSFPYDCSSESYSGAESQFGSTDTNGFSGADGSSSFTGSVSISTTQTMCGYVVYDVTASSSNGETIEIGIANPTTDVTVTSDGIVSPETSISPTGSTVIQSAELTQTHYHWLNDDGVEGVATSIEGNEDLSATGFANGTVRRLRLQVSNEGSTSSAPVQLRLEYGAKVTTCDAISSWIDIADVGGDWDMGASAFITDGANSSDLLVASGGTTNENTVHLGSNGALRDTTSQLGALTFGTTNFLEAEFAIEPTATATQGTSYCFRLSDAGSALRNYSIYAEGTISADVDVTTFGSQVSSLNASTTDQYFGGGFTITRNGSSRDVTSITITETGSIDGANDLSNIQLYFETAADCTLETYGGGESQFGTTDVDGFSAENGSSTFTGTVSITTGTEMCVYVVGDIENSAGNNETIDIEISDPSTDVVVTSSSIAPNTPVSITGSTTVATFVLTQTHYHWRNDDGSETGATSASGGVEDSPIVDIPKESTRRLRMQVSNEGAITSPASTYRLEYGVKVGACSLVSSWFDVGAVGGAFDMSLSANIADGNTTNISPGTVGETTDENTTFVGTGALRETVSESAAIALTNTEFTELEYSIEATDEAGFGVDYCFRVSDAGSALGDYLVFAELSIRDQQDFFIQRGSEDFTGTSITLTAGVDYVAPENINNAFVRITNSHMTGAGGTAGAQDTPDDYTAYISNPGNLATSFTIQRPATADGNTHVSWEIVEYIGLVGADNEMIVRDVGTVTYGATSLFATGTAVVGVADDSDVVVFITGQDNPDAGTANYNVGLSASSWSSSTDEPVFERGDADSVAASVSYAVVEFTGANWAVQRVDHTYAAAGTFESEPITVVQSVSQTFLHAQKIAGEEQFNLDDHGHEIFLSSVGLISLELQSGVGSPALHRSIVWVIENQQSGAGALNVYRSSGTLTSGGGDNTTFNLDIGATVNTSNASIWINNQTTGGGNFHPRAILDAGIISDTQYALYRSDDGQNQDYRVEVVEWPVAEVSVRQNYYRFYADNDQLTPSDPWPVGGVDLGENTSITANEDPLGEGERVRLRMSLQVNNASQPQGIAAYKLQFGRQVTTCSAISVWSDVGAPGSGTIWRGFDGTPVDGTAVATDTPAVGTLLLSLSDVAGTYEEENNTALNPYQIQVGEDIEYDWLLEHNGATQRTDYCFRMVESDGTELDGYINYPALRTTGYTPVLIDWRWFTDESSVTPTVPMAAENIAPSGVDNGEVVKLRAVLEEVENAEGINVKFAVQYSQFSDFSDGGTFVTATSACDVVSVFCYADGGGVDNELIDAAVISSADSCVSGVGNGCGTHNEASDSASTLTHVASSKIEVEFTIEQVGPPLNTVYYFRVYDFSAGDPVAASSSNPSLVTQGPRLNFTISGVDSGTSLAGIVTDATSTPTAIPFNNMLVDTSYEVAQELSVDTNADSGYQLLMYATNQLTSVYGVEVPPITTTNTAPGGWATACTSAEIGCFGYHTTDATLNDGSTRFAPIDSYAALSTSPEEIMYSSVATTDVHEIIYRMQYTALQPAGDYEADIVYILTPVF